ncbi:cytidine deaminase [Halobacillus litoralis]|uniref:Cytidine deaminase n=1 Tax=Halobacillus litoralis TaxID=45668 RepID=A0A845FA60_9BACI|nr:MULTISPECIES: cytidine deaminase [Halobacillus]MEC3885894.1 cytidine deaminase [Halobacillus sp. HZG1]MYL71163.1 cytidine deaminase [Halobacillus litoralis]
METKQLINEAKKIRERAYVPYSKFPVGAALVTEDGTLYTGCNIENAAYPVTCCAERVAIFKAVSDGHAKFKELAVVADTKRPVPPCGSCRQVMSEFFQSDVKIYTTNLHGDTKTFTMEEILPFSFSSADLSEEEAE